MKNNISLFYVGVIDQSRKSHNAPASSGDVVQFLARPKGISPIKSRLSRDLHPLPRVVARRKQATMLHLSRYQC